MSKFDTYFLMTTNDISDYVKEKLDYFPQNADLNVKEIGDGNLNYVFLVKDEKSQKSLIVKQAGEVARISDAIKVSPDRNRIESEILQLQDKFAPHSVPQIYMYDTTMCACIMEDLSDHELMRTALMKHKIYPQFSEDITTFMVNTLLKSTDVVMDHKEKKILSRSFCNPELCEISEDLVLTEPFNDISNRNLVFPKNLDFVKKELYEDESLHLAVAKLKFEFMTNAQSLIHGDLHTGSVFVKEDSTRVFDPEFAFYGPIGYDVGNVIANLLFAWDNGYAYDKKEFCDWILKCIEEIIDLFKSKFLICFDENVTDTMAKVKGFKEYYLDSILSDTAGYTGTELIRRTVGMAQVKDVTTIEDEKTRAIVERANILFGKELILNRDVYKTGAQYVKAFKAAVEKAETSI